MKGLIVAAPQSGSGKTTVTLGLLRALRRRRVPLAPGKAGPDYIDPVFHEIAAGETCFNYDPWAMRDELILANATLAAQGDRTLVIEAMMGLFDGAADGKGSSGDLAALLGLPVVLVIDCARMSHSVAALAKGFAQFSPKVLVAGVILNRVGSERHEAMLRDALTKANVAVLGVLPKKDDMVLPERHLGLVQARENPAIDEEIDRVADKVEAGLDLDAILRVSRQVVPFAAPANIPRLPPPGQRIAVARDLAFAFSYEHMLFGWRRRGAEISFFSPLADEAPEEGSDAVILPGGYPELHAGRLSAARTFRHGIDLAIGHGAQVYGECGGFMVLGEGLIDADGIRHEMIGALPVVTSFAKRERHLGYRRLKPLDGFFWDMPLTGHEFHYSTIESEGDADRLFAAEDAEGRDLGLFGLRRGSVSGSYMHVIDRAQ
jgi:cobyrinic acid a,c-diamide synthase